MIRFLSNLAAKHHANCLMLCNHSSTFKETVMNKSTLSILMAALLATSGIAMAQNAPTQPAMAGTQGGSGPSPAQTAAPGNMPNTRADVKSQINTGEAKPGTQGGSGPSAAQTAAPGNMPNARADVKAEAASGRGTLGIGGGSAASPADNMNTKNLSGNITSAERKAKRDQRRAMAKSKREARGDTNAPSSGPGSATSPAR